MAMDSATAASMLAKFLAPGGGNVLPQDDSTVTDMLATRGLTHDLQNENETRLMNDPTNPILLKRAEHYSGEEAANPYSETNSSLRLTKAQDSTDVMSRFMNQQPMRDQQTRDAGALAQSTAYGHSLGDHLGDYTAEDSPVGVQALNARGNRDVAVAAAKGVDAAKMKNLAAGNITQGGAINLPPGVAGENQSALPGDSGGALIHSDLAKGIFAANGIDAGSQAIVGAILDYRLGAPEKAALARSGQMQKYLGMAELIDKNFDASQYDAGAALRKDMTTGLASKQIQSLTRIKSHMATLRDGISKLNNTNTGTGIVNPFMNWFKSEILGNSDLANYTKEQNIVDGESANAMSATGVGSDQGRKDQAAGVGGNSSYDQQMGHADTTDELLNGQSIALRNRISAVPRLLPLFEKLLAGQGGQAPEAPAPATNQPAVGQHGTVNGRDAIWNGQNWVAR